MFKHWRPHWHTFWKLRSIHLMRMVEHRADFVFWSVVASMWTVFNFFFFDMIYRVSGSVAGWSIYELYVLLSVFTILDAFTWSLFYYNMRNYSQMIFNGDLNQLLTKPVDTQFMLMTFHNSYNNIFRFAVGVSLLIWSLQKLQYSPSLLQISVFVVSLLLAFTFLYSLWFIMTTFSFYVEKLDNINEIFPAIRRAWQVPRSVYTGILSFVFSILIPLGLITSVPSEILLGRDSWGWVTYLLVVTIVTVILSRVFFNYSLKRYVGQAN
jgi:ABC-2 type transport system permease protein